MGSVSISGLNILVSHHQSMQCYKGLSECRSCRTKFSKAKCHRLCSESSLSQRSRVPVCVMQEVGWSCLHGVSDTMQQKGATTLGETSGNVRRV